MKNLCIIILFQVCSTVISLELNAQNVQLPDLPFNNFIPERNAFTPSRTAVKNSKNEVELTLFILFDTYKNYFSSQDLNSCSFYPSCSSYGLQAVKKHGVIFGMTKTFDRLSRCHGFSQELYEIDRKLKLQIDNP
jgi:putative membrane protein insertion efficiency factor